MKKIVALSLLIASVSFARELDLEKSIEMAQKNNRKLIQKSIDVEQKKLDQKVKVKEGLPSISAASNYHDFDKEALTGSYFQSGIVVSQPIFKGGKIYYGAVEAKERSELEEFNLLSDSLDLRFEVISSYVTCLQLKKVLEIYQSSYKEKTEELKKQQEFYKLGLIDKSETLRMETSVYQTQTSITEIKNKIEIQKLQLKNILGINIEENITLKDFTKEDIKIDTLNLRTDIEKTIKSGITSKKLDKNLEISKALEKSSRSSLMPQINAEYGYETLKDNSFSRSGDNWQWRAGLTFTWKLFNFGSGLDTYKSAKLETKKIEVFNQDALETLKQQITAAYLDMISYQEAIKTNKKAMETAEETYRIDREKFSNRLIDTIDFLKTESELRDAQLTVINSELDFYLSYEKYLTLLK